MQLRATGISSAENSVSIVGNSGQITIGKCLRRQLTEGSQRSGPVQRWQNAKSSKDIWTYDYKETYLHSLWLRKHDLGRWIQQTVQYKRWQSDGGCLWCYGTPGSGKSLLAAAVVEELTEEHRVLYFFVDYLKSDSLDAMVVFASLFRQILEYYGGAKLPGDVRKLLNDDSTATSIFRLREVLQKLATEDFVYVIDGVDQCEKNSKHLLEYLRVLSDRGRRVFVSSRHTLAIEAELRATEIFFDGLSFTRDIESFIEAEVDKQIVQPKVTTDMDLVGDIIAGLKTGANGMILWADLQIKVMAKLRSDSAIRAALDLLHKDIHDLYERCLSKVSEYGSRMLLWLVHSRRLLQDLELREAVSIEFGPWNPRMIPNNLLHLVDDCASLVQIKDGVARLVHPTLKKFLLTKSAYDETEVGPLCLHYLLSEEPLTVPLAIPSIFGIKIRSPMNVSMPAVGQRNFRIYAESNWHVHCRNLSPSSSHMTVLRRFIQDARPSMFPGHNSKRTVEQCVFLWTVQNGNVDLCQNLFSDHQIQVFCRPVRDMLPLSEAVRNEHLNVLFSFSKFYSMSSVDSTGKTYLHYAAMHSALIVRYLTNQQPERGMAKPDHSGMTPLHLACLSGNDGAVPALMGVCELDATDKSGRCALSYAQQLRYDKIIQILAREQTLHNADLYRALVKDDVRGVGKALDAGVDLDANTAATDASTSNVLQLAIRLNATKCASLLIDRGVSARIVQSALVYACQGAYWEFIPTFAAHTNVNIVDHKFGTPLILCASKWRPECVAALISAGADVNARPGFFSSALFEYLSSMVLENRAFLLANDFKRPVVGHSLIEKYLIQHGADLNGRGEFYGTDLQAACYSYRPELLRCLVRMGADVNASGGFYGNALQAAAAVGQVEMVTMLLEDGADVNFLGGAYGSALQAACTSSNAENPPVVDRANELPRPSGSVLPDVTARFFNKTDRVKILVEAGADVNAKGGFFGTALQAAAASGELESVKLLLAAGADVNIQGGRYGSALAAARSGTENGLEITRLLSEAGAKR